jgi:hypothetical protein
VAECSAPPGEEHCTRAGCRYHLARRDRWEHHLDATRDCAIAVANEGPRSTEQVAAVLGMTAERVRQIEVIALEKLRASGELERLFAESDE